MFHSTAHRLIPAEINCGVSPELLYHSQLSIAQEEIRV
jgi:hypothetical protein